MGAKGLGARAWLPTLELALAALAGALWYTQGGAVWFRGGGVLWQPLLLVGALWAVRLAERRTLRLRALDVLLALFLCSAVVSCLVAYDRERALAKLWLVVGAWAFYSAFAHQPDLRRLYLALALCGAAGAGLAVYFVAVHDWSVPAKVALISRAGAMLAAFLPDLPSHAITANVAGGLLALFLPFYLPLVRLSRRARRPFGPMLAIIWLLAGLVALGGWVLSASRGAWAAGLGAGLLWLGWWALGRLLPGSDPHSTLSRETGEGRPSLRGRGEGDLSRPWRARITTYALALVAGTILAVLLGAQVLRAGGSLAEALSGRLSLAEQSLSLARDYPFTGLGLGMFEMHFSIYTLLIHVGYIVNSHNAFLDLLIEQGVPGLALLLGAMLAAVVVALRAMRGASPERRLLLEAALASLAAGLIHGWVDDVLYGSRGLLLWFAPLGVIAAVVGWQRSSLSEVSEPSGDSSDVRPLPPRGRGAARLRAGVRVLLLCAVLALVVVDGRALAAAWQANLGALGQARIELNAYDQTHFNDPTMDMVRQRADLAGPVAHFARALALRPGQATASQRLAAIALARGEYTEARALMEACSTAGHADPATRLLLGDAWVATGEPERAAELVAGLPFAQARLQGQAWSRYHLQGQAAQEADADLAARLVQQYEAERALGQRR